MRLATLHNLFVIEDAAHAIDSFYKSKPLGGIGHFGCFSFHETKNIQCGEGGMLVINDERFAERAEIIWEKGTNRSKFFRGEIDKYGWVDTGSSFLPSDMLAAFLLAQLEHVREIQNKRINLWKYYYNKLLPLAGEGYIKLPFVPEFATNNGHMFYFICKSESQRAAIIKKLRTHSISAVFHYQSLHRSPFMEGKNFCDLVYSDLYSDNLLRLPFYFELTMEQADKICELIYETVSQEQEELIKELQYNIVD